MKATWLALAGGLLAATAARPFPAEQGFGVGFVSGAPSGISASLPIGEDNAFNAVLAYDMRAARLLLQADYVWHHHALVPVETGRVSLYYGPGARLSLSDGAVLGARWVVGMDYRFDGLPFQGFLEGGPAVDVLPGTVFRLTAGVGVRYYF